jgi:hypothetical protein
MKRLGYGKKGMEKLKKHPFFSTIDFKKLANN